MLIAVALMNSCNQPEGGQPMVSEQDVLTNEEVAHQVEALREALLTPNQATLEDLTFESLTYGHSSGVIEDQDTFIQTLVSGKSAFSEIELSDQTINIQGSTAIVRHTFFAHTADEGKEPGTVTIKVLTVWQKDGGKLRLLARQAVRF